MPSSSALQVASIVEDVLSVVDEEAARENDKLQLFTSAERFPHVFQQVQQGPQCL